MNFISIPATTSKAETRNRKEAAHAPIRGKPKHDSGDTRQPATKSYPIPAYQPAVQFLDASSWTNARIPTVEAMRLNDATLRGVTTAPRSPPCSSCPGPFHAFGTNVPGPRFLQIPGKTGLSIQLSYRRSLERVNSLLSSPLEFRSDSWSNWYWTTLAVEQEVLACL